MQYVFDITMSKLVTNVSPSFTAVDHSPKRPETCLSPKASAWFLDMQRKPIADSKADVY